MRIRCTVDEQQVAYDAASDRMSLLLTSDRQVASAELFAAYTW